MNDTYKNGFENELPSLKTEEERRAVKAAVMRFINEVKEQIVDIANKKATKVITGKVEISSEPQVVLPKNPDRKVAYVKNYGSTIVEVFGVDEQTNGGYVLNYSEQVMIHGTNSIMAMTLSGISTINYLDS